MPTIVKAAGPRDFLSMVPTILGFQPRQSIVVVPFGAGRSLGAMRFDLPGPTDDVDKVASTIVGLACRVEGATHLAAIVYTTDPHPAALPILNALESRVDECGLGITELLYVAGDGWGSQQGGEPAPLAELEGFHHPDVTPPADTDQAAGATLPDVADEDRAAVVLAMDELAEAIAAVTGGLASPFLPTTEALLELAGLDDLPALFDVMVLDDLDPDEITPYRIASLIWCLNRPALRDVGMLTWAGGRDVGDTALAAQLGWEQGEDYPVQLAEWMYGAREERPDSARLTRALAVTRRVAALAPSEQQPGPLAMCAWLSWALGLSTHADIYARQALAIDPEHGLAEIMVSFVRAGHLPQWAFSR